MEIARDTAGPVARHSFRAQSYDVDFAEVVSNIAYLRWCEDLRLALTDELLPGWETGKYGNVLVVAETKIRYRRPVHLYDILEGACRITATDGKFFIMSCEFHRKGELTTHSEHKCCMVDAATGKAAELPEAIAAAL